MQNVVSEDFDWICSIEDYTHCLDADFDVLLINVVSNLTTEDFPADWSAPLRLYYLQNLSSLPMEAINGTYEIVGGLCIYSDSEAPCFNSAAYDGETAYLQDFEMHTYGV
jgi:hypothetical protein